MLRRVFPRFLHPFSSVGNLWYPSEWIYNRSPCYDTHNDTHKRRNITPHVRVLHTPARRVTAWATMTSAVHKQSIGLPFCLHLDPHVIKCILHGCEQYIVHTRLRTFIHAVSQSITESRRVFFLQGWMFISLSLGPIVRVHLYVCICPFLHRFVLVYVRSNLIVGNLHSFSCPRADAVIHSRA